MKYFESINDKNIMKAIFLAGGPGSGKSYVASEMFNIAKDNISFLGVKLLNIDIPFERGLKKENLPMTLRTDISDLYVRQMEVREWARKISEENHNNYINSLLPILLDGTGKNFKKIERQADALRLIGYDVSMVFVNTTLEVALQRNAQRERSVDPALVEKMWVQVQANLGKFQKYFGKDNFYLIDNSDCIIEGTSIAEKFKKEVTAAGREILSKPLRNPIGKANIVELRKIGGKYLSDLPARPILTKRTENFLKRDQKRI